jgi:hypothetical protein
MMEATYTQKISILMAHVYVQLKRDELDIYSILVPVSLLVANVHSEVVPLF